MTNWIPTGGSGSQVGKIAGKEVAQEALEKGIHDVARNIAGDAAELAARNADAVIRHMPGYAEELAVIASKSDGITSVKIVSDLAVPWISQAKQGIKAQGKAFEDFLIASKPQNALPENYPAFDLFDDVYGIGQSAKTMDTQTLAKILNPKQIESTLTRYIDTVADFLKADFGKVEINAENLFNRVIEFGVPAATSKQQMEAIINAALYAKSKNIVINLYLIK